MPDVLAFHPDPTDLASHPAVNAWESVGGRGVTEVHVLLNKGLRPWGKSSIYRLTIGSRDEFSIKVVAKKGRRDRIELEQRVYERILPDLPITKLGYLGSVPAEDPHSSWIFIEDAGDAEFEGSRPTHQRIATEWVSAMHISSMDHQEVRLLDGEGSKEHRSTLRDASFNLTSIPRTGLSSQVIRIYDRLSEFCVCLDDVWGLLEEWFSLVPPCLVHGDLVPKNLRIATASGSMTFFALDWERASYSVPATDLTIVSPSLYLERVRAATPSLTYDDVKKLALLGRVLLTLGCIEALTRDVEPSWYEAIGWELLYYADSLSHDVPEILDLLAGISECT